MSMSATSWGTSSITARYDAEATLLTGPHARHAFALAALPRSAIILDVAAGTGALTFHSLHFVSSVVSTDYSQGMVAFIADKAQRLGEAGRVTAEVRDAQDLSAYPDSSFDAVFCCFGLMMVPDKQKALKEMHRVVKPRGKLVVATWAAYQRSQLHALLMGCMKRAAAARTNPPTAASATPPPTSDTVNLNSIPLSSEEQLSSLFATASFSSVHITALPLATRVYQSPVDFWHSCKGSSPMFLAGSTADENRAMDEAAINWMNESIGENAAFNLHSVSLIVVATK